MTAIGRSVLNYFGSKVSTAHKYPPPNDDLIIEPFAGGAGYSLCYWERDVVLVDMNPDVVDVWDYVIHADPDEIRALPLLEPGQRVQDLGLTRGPELLLRWTTGRVSGTPGNYLFNCKDVVIKRGPETGRVIKRRAAFWGRERREQVAKVSAHIKHWHVFRCSYADLPTDVRATWFVDPPYQDAGRNYPFGSSRIDYASLGQWCQSLAGQTIVCENEGADWLPFVPFIRDKRGATFDAVGAPRRRTEVIWTNDSTSYY